MGEHNFEYSDDDYSAEPCFDNVIPDNSDYAGCDSFQDEFKIIAPGDPIYNIDTKEQIGIINKIECRDNIRNVIYYIVDMKGLIAEFGYQIFWFKFNKEDQRIYMKTDSEFNDARYSY